MSTSNRTYSIIPPNEHTLVPTMTGTTSVHDIAHHADRTLDLGQQRRRKIACGTGTGFVIVCLIAATGFIGWYFTQNSYLQTYEVIGSIGINVNTRTGVIYVKGDNEIHGIKLGQTSQGSLVFSKTCTIGSKSSEWISDQLSYLCLMYGVDKAKIPEYRLLIQNTQSDVDGFECYNIRWDFPVQNSVKDCLLMSNLTRFYGGGIKKFQTWPSDSQPLNSQPITPDFTNNQNGFLSVAVPYWIFTSGVSLMLDTRTGTFVNWDNSSQTKSKEFCFGTAAQERTQLDLSAQVFAYSVCLGKDIAHAHRKSLKKFTSLSSKMQLDDSVIRKPMWNTLAYGIDEFNNLDQQAVQTLATQLLENDLPASQIVIDPRWEHHPGDDTFNSEHFLDPSTLFAWLRNGPAKINPVLMMHPFVSLTSSTYGEFMSDEVLKRYLAKDEASGVSKVKWWMGDAVMLDFTEYNAVRYKEIRTKTLLESYQMSGVGCRFLGGSSGWVSASVGSILKSRYWQDLYAAFEVGARRICGANVQLEIAVQFSDTFIIMPGINADSSSTVEDHLNRQLASLIPTALTTSLLGHSVFVSTPVGGNPFLDENGKLDFEHAESRFPSPNMFLRWLGVVLFMPVIEFSVPPWFYLDHPHVLDVTKKLLNLRSRQMDYIVNVARQSWTSGEPMLMPLWWRFPRDPVTWSCSDQFFIGDKLMAAPIITTSSESRDIYLPTGNWTDAQGRVVAGPGWIQITAAIDEVPYFFFGL